MGTLNKQTARLKKKAEDTRKIKLPVEKDLKAPKDKKRRAFKPTFLNYKKDLYGNPFYSPKRKKK